MLLGDPTFTRVPGTGTLRAKLEELLSSDLDFHDQDSSEMSHDFHAFPAKFPPQLPRTFITHLTRPGERVLDPMMGSGTTILEAVAQGREAIGFDIDPLAVMLTQVKVKPLNPGAVQSIGLDIADRAERALDQQPGSLEQALADRFQPQTRKFIDYWFSRETQLELGALLHEIERIPEPDIQRFLLLAFSAIIITKSGGVSLAWDLAHTRPHKLKQGVSKTYRPALKEYRKRLLKNIAGLEDIATNGGRAFLHFGNAEALPLRENSVDLLFTSPPYASNAIDYMRAHKFSLAWLGHHVDDLTDLRGKYIGGEKVAGYQFLELPSETQRIVTTITRADEKKGGALRRYYSEMQRVLAEAFRVLKFGHTAVFVVGSSIMRGIDTQTQNCLGEIGASIGFDLVGIGTRKLDRDRRMMPARLEKQGRTQIEERMHEEYVVSLLKPAKETTANGQN